MNNIKKIIIIVLVNLLLAVMGYYFYNYMVDEYKIFVSRNKLRLTVVSLEEANAIVHGGGVDEVMNSLVTTFREDLSNARASFLDQS
jgi:hypothetical protein